MKAKVIAIIPARGGSKGIPRKNVIPIAGRPLLAYSIAQALRTESIGRVIVSTDDPEIASVAQGCGAEVVMRPAEISGDKALVETALLHVLDTLREKEGYEPELVVFLQPTSPLRRNNDIQNAIETLQREGADSLFSACPVKGFIWRKAGHFLSPVNYDPESRPNRQELTEEMLEENGSIYVFKPWVLRKHNSRLGGKIAVYKMSRLESFQVDVPEDLQIVERLLALRPERMCKQNLAGIRLLILDFDGVMTDNRLLVDQDGRESVICNRGDGWGIARIKEAGVEVIVLSTEANPVVAARCCKLQISCIQDCKDKKAALEEYLTQQNLNGEDVAYVGNDVNDLEAMRLVGCAVAPSDAHPSVRRIASIVTRAGGGQGVVRELADMICLQNQQTDRRH